MAGRVLEVEPVSSGDRPWTDGSTVYLDPDETPTELVKMVAVQASLLRAGSLEPDIVRRLGRRPAAARRYLAVEGHRALAANVELLPWSAESMIDHALAATVVDAAASLDLSRHHAAALDPPPAFGEIRPRRVLSALAPDPMGESPRSRVGSTLPDKDAVAVGYDDDEDERDIGDVLATPAGGGGPIGRLLQRLLAPTRSRRGGSGPAGADTLTRLGRVGTHGRAEPFVGQPVSEPSRLPPGEGSPGTLYPEWDVHARRYRPDWCTVVEVDPAPGDLRPMPMPSGRSLRKPLIRLGLGVESRHRMPQGHDIDVDAAVEARVQALAGSAVDDDVYVEAIRGRRDLAVLILLDVSGSAGEGAPGATTVHEHQRIAAAALSVALHEMGDRVALHAFNSRGRTAVQVTTVKRFDDPFDARVGERLGGLEPAAYTRLGAAIRHGAALVQRDGGTPRPLLVVISDGFAYDSGYEGRYGEADARRALMEARRRGVGCACLSVGAAADPAALRRVFGTAAHASVSTVDELPGVVGPVFLGALRSAEAQHRAFVRKERTRERLELERMAS